MCNKGSCTVTMFRVRENKSQGLPLGKGVSCSLMHINFDTCYVNVKTLK